MELVKSKDKKSKKDKPYEVYKKANGRYAVMGSKGQWINGVKKAEILVSEGLLKHASQKKAEEEQAPAEAEAASPEGA